MLTIRDLLDSPVAYIESLNNEDRYDICDLIELQNDIEIQHVLDSPASDFILYDEDFVPVILNTIGVNQ